MGQDDVPSGVRPVEPRAILFDLDGTLVDSRLDIAAACNHVLVEAGHEALPASVIVGYVGDGARRLLARAFDMPDDAPALDELLGQYVRYYEAHAAERTRLMAGARDVLEGLAHLPMAVVTNKPTAVTRRLLDALAVSQHFRAIVGAEGRALKPDPEPVMRALEALDVPAHEAWLVGDGVQDIGAGRAAGCFTIAVAAGFQEETALRAAGPDVVLACLAELLPLVRACGPRLPAG